MTVRNSSEQQS